MNDALLTIPEVAERLRVCTKTVRSYLSEGLLPYIQLSGRRRKLVRESALALLLAQHEKGNAAGDTVESTVHDLLSPRAAGGNGSSTDEEVGSLLADSETRSCSTTRTTRPKLGRTPVSHLEVVGGSCMRARRVQAPPPGFCYVPDFVSAEEEKHLMELVLDLPNRGFQWSTKSYTGRPTNRAVIHFGAAYTGKRTLDSAPPLLPEFFWVRDRCASHADAPADGFTQAIVSRYPAGSQIGAHVDKLLYGPVVLVVSFRADGTLYLRDKDRQTFVQKLAPRSLYMLSGPARYEWTHRVRASARGERFSITLRSLAR